MKKLNNGNVTEHFTCACSSPDHTLLLTFNIDTQDKDFPPEVYASVSLVKFSFWQRLKNCFDYLFGRIPKYGHFGEFIFRTEEAVNMINFLMSYLKITDEWAAKWKVTGVDVDDKGNIIYKTEHTGGSK